MDAYCPRCQTSTRDVDEAVLQKGECPACGGQMSLGAVAGDSPVDGAIAMTFGAGSRIGVPLDASFEQTRINSGGPNAGAVPQGMESEVTQPSARRLPPQPPPDGLSASDGLDDEWETTAGGSSDGETTATGGRPGLEASDLPDELTAKTKVAFDPAEADVPTAEMEPHLQASLNAEAALGAVEDSREEGAAVSDESTVKGPDESGVGDAEAPGDDLGFGGPTMDVPAHLQTTSSAEAAVGTVEDQAAEPSTEQPGAAPAALPDEPTVPDEQPAAGLGAHLQLPSIDFSVPDLGVGSTDLPATSTSQAPPTDIPAHLQLPSFPDFELPPIPGEGPETNGEFSIEGVGGGSFGHAETAVPPGESGANPADGWQVATAEPGAPPPLPEPPPIPAAKKEPAPAGLPSPGATPAAGGALPDLPAFGLPAFDAKKSEPTLVQTNVALQLSKDEPGRRSLASKIAIGLLVLLGLAAVGSVATVATVGVDDAMKWINPPKERSAVEVRREKADAAYYEGVARYKEAIAAEEAKKTRAAKMAYEAAVAKFNEALKHEPKYGEAQRNLGIVFAKLNNQKQAVKHYRLYLKLKPKAKDKKDVLKIINDYEEAQQKLKRRN